MKKFRANFEKSYIKFIETFSKILKKFWKLSFFFRKFLTNVEKIC